MDDLERWLRAAMADVAQQPPAGLLDRIWRRRRRSHLRATVGFTAMAAVIAIGVPTAAVLAQRGGANRNAEAGNERPGHQATEHPVAAPGTVLLACPVYNRLAITGGEIGSNWRAASIQAGPVWFVYARTGSWRAGKPLRDGKLAATAGVIVAVRNGSVVEITTPLPDRSHFRFVTRVTNSGQYTLREGVSGLTLAGCPRQPMGTDMPAGYAAGLTLFYLPLGYVTDLAGCLPMEVATPPLWHAHWIGMLPLAGQKCR